MVLGGTHTPFYKRVQGLINFSLGNPDVALDDLIKRDPFFYHKGYIRFFLNYGDEKIENMGVQEFVDCMALVHELKEFWHLPFKKKD